MCHRHGKRKKSTGNDNNVQYLFGHILSLSDFFSQKFCSVEKIDFEDEDKSAVVSFKSRDNAEKV